MATLEAVRQPRHEGEQQRDGAGRGSSNEVILPGETQASSGIPTFPTVPSFDPRSAAKEMDFGMEDEQHTEEVVKLGGGHSDASRGQRDQQGAGEEASPLDDEEMEEVLEELQDDEIEEMADDGLHSLDTLAQPLDSEVETGPLLDVALSACFASVKSALQTILVNPAQVTSLGGRDAVENVLRASEDAVTSFPTAATVPFHPEQSSGASPLKSGSASEALMASMQHLTLQSTESGAENTEDLTLLSALKSLMASMDAARRTVDHLDGQFHHEQDNVVSPTTSQASSASPIDHSLISPVSFFTQQQQNRALKSGGLGRLSNAGQSPSLAGSNPSSSREELRNPFSDSGHQPSSALSDERSKERSDRELGSSARFGRVLDLLEKRCMEVIAQLEVGSHRRDLADSEQSNGMNPVILGQAEDDALDVWKDLQSHCRASRMIVATRRQSSPVSLSLADSRRGSTSPITYSPTYSPSRGRSRRKSGASLKSIAATSLSSLDVGDPAGEAIAAGVGIGARRSLSRLSSHSGRGVPANAGHPSTSGAAMASLLSRRGSTKSEGTGSYSVHSPPPRYSEDSIRNWSGLGWGMPGSSAEGIVSSGEQDVAMHRRRSSGNRSLISTRTLPAYNVNESGDRSSMDKKGSSTSSLTMLDANGLPIKGEESAARGRSASDSAQFPLADSRSIPRTPGTVQGSANTSEYLARTSQDLRMLEASIDRLYTAVPQLEDQRASSPVERKQRLAQKQDEMLKLVERLSKGGRMEDQRAMAPAEASRRQSSVAASPELSSEASSSGAPTNGRLVKRLGSITFGTLSLRRAASILGPDSKGKEKERTVESSFDLTPDTPSRTDSDTLTPPVRKGPTTREAEVEEQRSRLQSGTRAGTSKKPPKLDLMGVSAFDGAGDDALFDALSASLVSSRMSDQDAVLRPPVLQKRAPAVSSPATARGTSFASQPATPHQVGASSTIATETSTTPTNLSVGESLPSSAQDRGKTTDRHDRSVSNRADAASTLSEHALSYLAETQPRLGCMSVVLWTSAEMHYSTAALCYRIDSINQQSLQVLYRHASYTFALPCPCLPIQNGIAQASTGQQWQIKLRLAQVDSTDKTFHDTPTPMNASALQRSRPCALACNVCLCAIAETESIAHYLPLPSQHWEELVDAWMCHADQELNQGMLETQRRLHEHQGITREHGRVSDTCIVLHPSHLNTTATKESELRLRCRSCSATLGQRVASGAIKLFKYAIREVISDHATITVSSSCVAPVIAGVLIRLSRAHATRHFLLRDDDEDGGAEQVCLWLFLESFDVAFYSPNRKVMAGMGLEHSQSTATSSACKIMYRSTKMEPSGLEDSARQLSPAWAQPELVEHLQFPKEVCQKVMQLLHQSTQLYPPSQRSFGTDWSIGFLPTALPFSITPGSLASLPL